MKHARVLFTPSCLSSEPSNKTPLSPWFTIFSVTDPPPSTPQLGLVLHQASASLKSRLELTFKNPTTPGTFLRMKHWASQSRKSQDVGCWPALRTSLSFYHETQSKHSKHFLAVSGSSWMSQGFPRKCLRSTEHFLKELLSTLWYGDNCYPIEDATAWKL